MFGKLIKNDFKSSARSVSIIYFAAAIITVAMVISLFTGFGVGKIVCTVALMITCWLALVITIVQMFGDFRNSMFRDRGYLTNTLPVKSFAMVLSKWIVSVVWILISAIYIALSYILLYAYYTGENGAKAFTMLLDYLPMLGLPEFDILKKALPFYAIKVLCWLLVNVAIVYFSVTISNIKPLNRGKAFSIIVVFFLVFGVVNALGHKLDELVSFAITVMPETGLKLTVDRDLISEATISGGCYISLTQIYFEIIIALAMFVATAELIEKKINVD